MKKDLLSMMDINQETVEKLLSLAADIKKDKEKFACTLKGKTLLMIFEKPSLRTRISFEVGMKSLGGDVVNIEANTTPLGIKESIEDTAKVCSRYVDCIMARLFEHEKMRKLADNSTIPVINGLTDDYHPIQILSDLLTIKEKKGKLAKLKVAYFGDAKSNVCHDLIIGCALMDMDIFVACPKNAEPKSEVLDYAKKIAKAKIVITQDAKEAAKDADVIYTDSWMSYHVSKDEKESRQRLFLPYQVNAELVRAAKKDYIFMNCLPADREMEQTAEIIDGPNSVVFDQAENRLHMQKAILIRMIKN